MVLLVSQVRQDADPATDHVLLKQKMQPVLFELENVPAVQFMQRLVVSGSEYVPRVQLEQIFEFEERLLRNSNDFVVFPKIS